MQSIERDQEKNRPELILEESGKLSVKEQECILATIRGMVFTRSCFLKMVCIKTKKNEFVYSEKNI